MYSVVFLTTHKSEDLIISAIRKETITKIKRWQILALFVT